MKYILLIWAVIFLADEPDNYISDIDNKIVILDGKYDQESIIIEDTLYANWYLEDSCLLFDEEVEYGKHKIKKIESKSKLKL